MTKAMKKCKVCGADYEYCHTVRRTTNIFRWQDVACCPEHGSIYFARVLESRKPKEFENVVLHNDVKEDIKEEVVEISNEVAEDINDATDFEYDYDDDLDEDEDEVDA